MISKRLDDFLKENHVGFKTFVHPEAFTAQEIAAVMHVKGRELAKPVMLKADGKMFMAVLPATSRLDFRKIKDLLHENDIALAPENEFMRLFPDCEPGAEPPFGNLYNVETLVDSALAKDEHIYFNAGNHYEAIEMEYSDFERLVKPKVADIGA